MLWWLLGADSPGKLRECSIQGSGFAYAQYLGFHLVFTHVTSFLSIKSSVILESTDACYFSPCPGLS